MHVNVDISNRGPLLSNAVNTVVQVGAGGAVRLGYLDLHLTLFGFGFRCLVQLDISWPIVSRSFHFDCVQSKKTLKNHC